MEGKIKLPEVAKRLELPYSTTLSIVHTGRIKATKYGKLWYVEEEEVERFKKEGNVKAERKNE